MLVNTSKMKALIPSHIGLPDEKIKSPEKRPDFHGKVLRFSTDENFLSKTYYYRCIRVLRDALQACMYIALKTAGWREEGGARRPAARLPLARSVTQSVRLAPLRRLDYASLSVTTGRASERESELLDGLSIHHGYELKCLQVPNDHDTCVHSQIL